MSESDQQQLSGTRIGIFLAPEGTEEIEFTEPKQAVSDAGADVDVLSSELDEAQTVNNDLTEGGTYEPDKTFEDAPDDYDALIVPGGTVGSDTLRMNEDAINLLQTHIANGKPVGVICHGPWLLIEANAVHDRTITSYPSLQTDIRNAGGEWVDEEVVRDDRVVTSRKPDDLEAFCAEIVDAFSAITVEQ